MADALTKLLLHFDSDATDSSKYAATATSQGSPSVVATHPKFGMGEASLTGSSDDAYIFTDSNQYDILGDFTIDLWLYPINDGNQNYYLVERYSSSSDYWGLHYNTSTNAIQFLGSVDSTAFSYSSTTGLTLSTTSYNHICVSRLSGTLHFYLNGTHVGSHSSTEILTDGALYIGATNTTTADGRSKFLDEVRLSTTSRIADVNDELYIASENPTAGFTLPTSAYSSYIESGGISYDVIHWEYDANDDLQPLVTAKDINYPSENLVFVDTVYGYDDQYTGLLSGGGTIPTQPKVRIVNNQDDTATATVSNSDSDATNTLYIFLRHGGVLELIEAGSRVGDGHIGIDKPEGEYIGYVISTRNGIRSMPSNPDGFWITQDRQYLIRTAAAEAELQAIRLSQFGIQCQFKNGNTATAINIWASMSGGSEQLQIRDSIRTNIEDLELHVPRQTGFPPQEFRPGAKIILPSEKREYEIDIVESSNAILERSSSFRIVTGNYRWLNRLDTVDTIVDEDGADLTAQIIAE